MNNIDYRRQQQFIMKTIEMNNFQLFFTLRDLRQKGSYKSFRSTSGDGIGYYEREKIWRTMFDIFRRAYRLRGGHKNRKDFFYFGIHESGVGRKHWLCDDSGHLHVAIGFTKNSRYYIEPKRHLDRFLEMLNAKPRLNWLDLCMSTTLADGKKLFSINNKKAVARYMAKVEIGSINGGNFSKNPFFDGEIQLPESEDLILEPLPVF